MKGNLIAAATHGLHLARYTFCTEGLLQLPSEISSRHQKNDCWFIGVENFDVTLIDFRIQIREKPRDEMNNF